MSLSKPIELEEGISLEKAIKQCYIDYSFSKLKKQVVVYSILFLDKIDLNLYFIIRFNNKDNSLSYGLEYLEGD